MGTSGVITNTEDTSKSSHHKNPGEGGSWGQSKERAAAKRTEYSQAEETFRQSKLQNPGRGKTLKTLLVYYHAYC